ncbi:glycoside hydrolase family 1 protein [Cronobacter turicensis]|uniref:glycoside hydrolase family 1 protein n=1 Tax=Cronobacter turicensis TaxID=413502 RepID=UPI0013754594|nr:glycoside hydrolase family 1 protein [Cronobacter turicensis]EGT5682874.1 glycoside hydrolase family 1 protein [Cronobacter turicensis]EGT5739247.1 glycoside hydrolase family 1 protein [Cronobacter turicensis]EKM0363112.1 glycoside hydrolase family 1 protein [Cronobacter turicensis]EKM0374796.1 glycoside hydrolase family 1 protein [Cronobacter turicensis]EKM5063051.1 glycoside hydrolase family 1 protein [Cronobacter turicensis]
MTHTLPDGFLWGNSVSSMQTEGAWNEDGKGPSVYDIREASEFASDWKVATDSYHRYEEDFDLMADLGMNCYRFQIAWSRVCPEGDGEFNPQGIAFYERFIDGLLARGIAPMICLYHFDMPLALAQKYNGFMDRRVMDAFVRYGQKMIDCFGGRVKYWLTFNEQNIYHMPEAFRVSGYLQGDKTLRELYQIQHHVMMAHCQLTHYLHQQFPGALMGGMLAHQLIYPATCKPRDIFCAQQYDEFLNQNLLRAFAGQGYSPSVMAVVAREGFDDIFRAGDLAQLAQMKNDFMAFSYYASKTLDSDAIPDDAPVNDWLRYGDKPNPWLKATEWNWQIDPLGFRTLITRYYNDWRLPVFPIENGIGVIEQWDGVHPIEDDYRIAYHRDHINAMKAAITEDGAQVMGYLGWGLIDILSSQGDMRKRYGVVYVNRENHDLKDLKRVPKKSYGWLKQAIASNGETL